MASKWERRCRQRHRTQARAHFAQGRMFQRTFPKLSLPAAEAAAEAEAPEASVLDAGLMMAAAMPLLMRGGRRKG